MSKIVRFIITALAIAAPAFAQEKQLKVAATVQQSGANLGIEFKVVLGRNLVVNRNGPWSLTITDPGGLKLARQQFSLAGFNASLPGFSIQSAGAPRSKSGELRYRLTAFVCTKDKSRCFREVHEGSVPWTIQQFSAQNP
jgi:hypothetical protein